MANKGIFVSTNIKGAPVSLMSSTEQENGMLFERGAIVTDKPLVYNAVVPTDSAPVYVSGDPAWSYDNSSIINQNEDEYVIPAKKNFRAYPLAIGDRFTVANYGIDGATSVATGDIVGLASGSTKPVIGGSTDIFEGVVVKVDTQGFAYNVGQTVDVSIKLVTIEVVKNG